MFRAGNDGRHYGGYRHHSIYKTQCGKYGIRMVGKVGYADRSGSRCFIVRFLWLPYGCLSGCCRRGFQHVFSFEGICRFSCAYRYEVVWHGPFPAAACMGSGAEHAADCFCSGVLLPLLYIGDYIALLALVILVCLTMPFTKMFVKLSHHCQRGTANTTCYLAMETGLLAGLATACRLADAYLLYHAAGVATILAIFFFALLTYPYYKKKKG